MTLISSFSVARGSRQRRRHADALFGEQAVQLIDALDVLAGKADDDVAFPQARFATPGCSARSTPPRMPDETREAVEPDELPRQRRVLPGHADVRAPDAAVANQPADDELRGVRGDGEAEALRAGE